jgi:hypothetical protein
MCAAGCGEAGRQSTRDGRPTGGGAVATPLGQRAEALAASQQRERRWQSTEQEPEPEMEEGGDGNAVHDAKRVEVSMSVAPSCSMSAPLLLHQHDEESGL